jgi:hypothetical protein
MPLTGKVTIRPLAATSPITRGNKIAIYAAAFAISPLSGRIWLTTARIPAK